MAHARSGTLCVHGDGRIYVVGGSADGSAVVGVLERYDPLSDQWTALTPMPTPRAALAVEAVSGRLYAIGGTNSPGAQQFDIVEIYDPDTDSWSSGENMPTARAAPASVVIGDQIWIIGGGVGSTAQTLVEIYHPATNSWQMGPPLSAARVRLAAAFAGGRVFAIGGAQSVTPPHPGVNIVEGYEPEAVSFPISSCLNDAWYNPATNGQGFFITVFEDIGSVFLAWFTYDTERPPDSVTAILGEPGHRWLTAFGSFQGSSAVLDIEVTVGGVFDSAAPPVSQHPDGSILLEFLGPDSGSVTYDIPSAARQGIIPIQRIATDNVSLCQGTG